MGQNGHLKDFTFEVETKEKVDFMKGRQNMVTKGTDCRVPLLGLILAPWELLVYNLGQLLDLSLSQFPHLKMGKMLQAPHRVAVRT